jgi:hypothetical protein
VEEKEIDQRRLGRIGEEEERRIDLGRREDKIRGDRSE